MEKILRYLMVAVVAFVPAVFPLTSCSDDTPPNEEEISKKIPGVWKAEALDVNSNKTTIFVSFEKTPYTTNFAYFQATETPGGIDYLDFTPEAGCVESHWGMTEKQNELNSQRIWGVVENGHEQDHSKRRYAAVDFVITDFGSKKMQAYQDVQGIYTPITYSGNLNLKKSSEKEMLKFREQIISNGREAFEDWNWGKS